MYLKFLSAKLEPFLTTISTTNTEVKDQLLFLNSGSNSGDAGIVVQNGAHNSGSAFVFDDSEGGWICVFLKLSSFSIIFSVF